MKETKKLSKDKKRLKTHNVKVNLKAKELATSEKQSQKSGWWSE